MDWTRAKNILIILFLALNIFLAVNIGTLKWSSGISKDTISNTIEILESKGITLKQDIPGFNGSVGNLNFENGKVLDKAKLAARLLGSDAQASDDSKTVSELTYGSRKLKFKSEGYFAFTDENPSENVNIKDFKSSEKYIRKYIKDLKLPFYKLYMDKAVSNADGSLTIVFVEKYKDFLIFDNKIEAVVTEKGIKALECSVKRIKGVSKGTTRVIPAYQLLLSNINGLANTTIDDINLGFKAGSSGEEMKEAPERPVWRIRFQDGRVKYFSNTGTGLPDEQQP